MKKIALVVIGIGLFFLSVFTTAEAQVAFDGKNLVFPRGACMSPVNVSSFDFDLENVPPDKKFVEGKVFGFIFTSVSPFGVTRVGPYRYAIFTKWTEDKIELFYPGISVDEKPFLDCATSANDEYACVIRGRKGGYTYKIKFQQDQKISITTDGGADANSEVVGQIPVWALATKVKMGSLQP
jgi:hypothetical protein